MKGEAMLIMNLTPASPTLLISSSLDEKCSQSDEEIKERKFHLYNSGSE
jgi:hypothetical protein